MLKVALLAPVPARKDQLPESGVAAYTTSLVSAIAGDVEIAILAQASATSHVDGNWSIIPTWTPNRNLPRQVRRAVAQFRPDVLHVEHEFNLYGGLIQGGLLTAELIAMRRRALPIVTTVHGVVDPHEISRAFLRRNALPGSPRTARTAFRIAYWGLSASSDLLIVHHDHFRAVLAQSYRIPRSKLLTIQHGADLSMDSGVERAAHRQGVLVIGFMTGYKLPELVVDVAEQGALPGVKFRFCVGRNPRIKDRAYLERYARLEQRVRALGARAEWSGYIPDQEMPAAFASAKALVLPYTECVSPSGVAALAQRSGVRICYSRPLRPLFGPGPLEFEMTGPALTTALGNALHATTAQTVDQFIPWSEAARLTLEAWQRLANT